MQYSHSMLDVIRQCMKKFYFKYEIKLDVEENKEYLNFGNLLHDISENYNGKGKKHLLKLYQEFKPKYDFNVKDFDNRIKIGLRNIHLFWIKQLKNNNFENEEKIKVYINEDISLTGKIDVKLYKNDIIEIIDFKTNKSFKYSDYTNQLSLYKYLIHEKYGYSYDKINCSIYYLALADYEKDGTKILNKDYNTIYKPYNIDDVDISVLLEEIEAVHNRIKRARKNKSWKANPTWFNCTFCPFFEHCDKKYNKNGKK